MARGSGEGGEVASGLGCDGRRHGEARRDAAVTAVVTAVAEGDAVERAAVVDLVGGGGMRRKGGRDAKRKGGSWAAAL